MSVQEAPGPIIVEPSQVYCMAGGKRCQYRGAERCNKAGTDIRPSRDQWRAPDWCPLAFDALFPPGQ